MFPELRQFHVSHKVKTILLTAALFTYDGPKFYIVWSAERYNVFVAGGSCLMGCRGSFLNSVRLLVMCVYNCAATMGTEALGVLGSVGVRQPSR